MESMRPHVAPAFRELVPSPLRDIDPARRRNLIEHSTALLYKALIERLQPRFDLRAARFQKWRQRQFFAERCQRLVGGEAGAVGGDLEQDAVGLAEIETSKIEPVDLAGVGNAEFVQPLRPGVILLVVRRAERNVCQASGRSFCSITCSSAAGPPSPIANTCTCAPASGAA